MFTPLNSEEIKQIIDIFLQGLRNRLADREINIELTDSAIEVMINEGYDPVYGARPLKRYISGTLETMLAKKLISGEIYHGSTVVIDVAGDNINITVK